MDATHINTVLLTVLTIFGGAGVTILYNFSNELTKVKVDIGGLKAHVDSLTQSVQSLVGLSLEKA